GASARVATPGKPGSLGGSELAGGDPFSGVGRFASRSQGDPPIKKIPMETGPGLASGSGEEWQSGNDSAPTSVGKQSNRTKDFANEIVVWAEKARDKR